MQNYVLSDVLTKVGYCFSGGYGICICRTIDGCVTRQILHEQGSGRSAIEYNGGLTSH